MGLLIRRSPVRVGAGALNESPANRKNRTLLATRPEGSRGRGGNESGNKTFAAIVATSALFALVASTAPAHASQTLDREAAARHTFNAASTRALGLAASFIQFDLDVLIEVARSDCERVSRRRIRCSYAMTITDWDGKLPIPLHTESGYVTAARTARGVVTHIMPSGGRGRGYSRDGFGR